MMSQEIIFPARIRSESLRMRKFEDSEINDGHHCAVFKKAEGVNTVYYSSHLSKKKSHSLNIHFFPSPVVEIGDTMLNETGVVSEDKRVSSFSYHGVSCPEIFTERPGKGFAYAHLSWLCSPAILPHTPREAYFKGDGVHKRRVHRKKRYAIGSSRDQTTLLEFVMYENEKKKLNPPKFSSLHRTKAKRNCPHPLYHYYCNHFNSKIGKSRLASSVSILSKVEDYLHYGKMAASKNELN